MSKNSELLKGIGKPKQVGIGTLRYNARLAQSLLNHAPKQPKHSDQSFPTYKSVGRGVSGESSN